jgi:hypothetical protein
VFLHDEVVEETADDVRFVGRAGWIRRAAVGGVQAIVPDGEGIEAFGVSIEGRGPWTYNLDGAGRIECHAGPPRRVRVVKGMDPQRQAQAR